jgi:DNA-binding NtrC family response regulator
VNLPLPPLRERPGDLVPLAEFFVRKYAAANGVSAKAISQGAQAAIRQAWWKGNVRELENTMHRAVLLAAGPAIEAADIRLPDGSAIGAGAGAGAAAASPVIASPAAEMARHASVMAESVSRSLVGRTIEAVEQEMILETLKHCLGNRTHAAQILGISIRTLRNKLNAYTAAGVDVPTPGMPELRAFG